MPFKILVADRSITARSSTQSALNDAGYEVIAVSNGVAALKSIESDAPDMLILDVFMPGYSGLEICEKVKASNSASMPVLLTVSPMEPFQPEEQMRVRADAVVMKPFDSGTLLSIIEKFRMQVHEESVPLVSATIAQPGTARVPEECQSSKTTGEEHSSLRGPSPLPAVDVSVKATSARSVEVPSCEVGLLDPVSDSMRTMLESAASMNRSNRSSSIAVETNRDSGFEVIPASVATPEEVTRAPLLSCQPTIAGVRADSGTPESVKTTPLDLGIDLTPLTTFADSLLQSPKRSETDSSEPSSNSHGSHPSPAQSVAQRRSERLSSHLHVTIRSLTVPDRAEAETAEVISISKHGGLLLCSRRFKVGEPIFLWWPEHKKGIEAKAVFRSMESTLTPVKLGFEFSGRDNFWGIDFWRIDGPKSTVLK